MCNYKIMMDITNNIAPLPEGYVLCSEQIFQFVHDFLSLSEQATERAIYPQDGNKPFMAVEEVVPDFNLLHRRKDSSQYIFYL